MIMMLNSEKTAKKGEKRKKKKKEETDHMEAHRKDFRYQDAGHAISI